jgi:hypothetical protein
MAQVMDIACLKIIKSKRHKKTGKLVFFCTRVLFLLAFLGFFGLLWRFLASLVALKL